MVERSEYLKKRAIALKEDFEYLHLLEYKMPKLQIAQILNVISYYIEQGQFDRDSMDDEYLTILEHLLTDGEHLALTLRREGSKLNEHKPAPKEESIRIDEIQGLSN